MNKPKSPNQGSTASFQIRPLFRRVAVLGVASAFMVAVYFVLVLVVNHVVAGAPSGDGGGQAGFAIVVALMASVVFVVSMPISVVGGAIVSLMLAIIYRNCSVKSWMGLLVGTLIGCLAGFVMAAIIAIAVDSGRVQLDYRELLLLCAGIAMPVGAWYGWRAARWFTEPVTHEQ